MGKIYTCQIMNQPPSLKTVGRNLMLTLPSQQQQVCHVEKFVSQIFSRFNINQDAYGNVLISLTEAVNNAIIHGNRKDKGKKVEISFEKCSKDLAFRVSDEGQGFDYDSLPDPTAPENICECGGRGVFLMRELSDVIRYTDEGRTVEMRFKV
ncbi:MAG: ATP-binding protein [Bacteroidota bacterium]